MHLGWIILALVVGSAAWVGFDAKRLRVERGCLGSKFADPGVTGWVVYVLLLWIICFPLYLAYRRRYVARVTTG